MALSNEDLMAISGLLDTKLDPIDNRLGTLENKFGILESRFDRSTEQEITILDTIPDF